MTSKKVLKQKGIRRGEEKVSASDLGPSENQAKVYYESTIWELYVGEIKPALTFRAGAHGRRNRKRSRSRKRKEPYILVKFKAPELQSESRRKRNRKDQKVSFSVRFASASVNYYPLTSF